MRITHSFFSDRAVWDREYSLHSTRSQDSGRRKRACRGHDKGLRRDGRQGREDALRPRRPLWCDRHHCRNAGVCHLGRRPACGRRFRQGVEGLYRGLVAWPGAASIRLPSRQSLARRPRRLPARRRSPSSLTRHQRRPAASTGRAEGSTLPTSRGWAWLVGRVNTISSGHAGSVSASCRPCALGSAPARMESPASWAAESTWSRLTRRERNGTARQLGRPCGAARGPEPRNGARVEAAGGEDGGGLGTNNLM